VTRRVSPPELQPPVSPCARFILYFRSFGAQSRGTGPCDGVLLGRTSLLWSSMPRVMPTKHRPTRKRGDGVTPLSIPEAAHLRLSNYEEKSVDATYDTGRAV